MTDTSATEVPGFVVLCVDDEPDELDLLTSQLKETCGYTLRIEGYPNAEELLQRAREAQEEGLRVPLLVADYSLEGMNGAELLAATHDLAAFRSTRKLLLSAKATMDDISHVLNRGALNGHLPRPWKPAALADAARHLLTEYFIDHAPEMLDELNGLVDVGQLSRALVTGERRLEAMDRQLKTLQRSFIQDQALTDEDVETNMIAEVDEALSNPERRTLPAGTVLLTEGEPVNGIYLLLNGQVTLYRKVGLQEQVFHSHTVGPVIGLMALANRANSFFTCRAITDIEVVMISLPELEIALQNRPMLSVHLVTVLLRSLARRNRRAVELQIEVNGLHRDVARERDQLAEALKQLEEAQSRLVQSEKMATLGQMSAGIAHELNNPVAAIKRAADFVREDLDALASGAANGETYHSMMTSALETHAVSTREERAQRAELGRALGDEKLARRLVRIGLSTPDAYREHFAQVPESEHEQRLSELEHYHQLGTSLKNIRSCAERITGLVNSLRSYARPDKDIAPDVDLHKGIEETLVLFGHALREVQVIRQYADIPHIQCRAGEITQVWTNLISNALQVMTQPASLQVHTDQPEPDRVRVRIIDNGPGIPPEHSDSIFALNFTTRQGEADFGLGLGLPICRDIVQRHHGTISVESKPGRTCFSVELPVHQPLTENGSEKPAASPIT